MLDCPTFLTHQEVVHVKKLRHLQEYLLNLTSTNFSEAKRFVVQNEYLKSNEGRAELVNNLLIASDLRPLTVSILADFTKSLISVEEDLIDNILIRVFEPIPETFNDMFTKSIELKFLRRCMDKGIFTYEEINTMMEKFKKQYPNHICFLLAFFCWFAPEMDSSTFIKYNSLMSEQLIRKKCPRFLTDFHADFPELRKNEWKMFKERVKYGHFMETVPYCIKYDKVETLAKLLTYLNFDVNQFVVPSVYEPSSILREGAPLIHLAAFYGSIRCFKFLLLNSANLEIRTDSQRTLAQYAVAGGNTEILRICEQNKLNFSFTLHIAALFNQNKIFTWLLDNKLSSLSEMDPILGTPLHQAVVGFNADLIKSLIDDYKVDPNIFDQKKRTPLHYAALCGRSESVKLLLNIPSVDPLIQDDCGNTAYQLATKNSKKEVIDEFLKNSKIDINQPSQNDITPLHILASEDHFNVLPSFIQNYDLNLNSRDSQGMTPLHYAVKNENLLAVTTLCNTEGVKINAADDEGITPLHLAVINGNLRIVMALVNAKGIDLNATSNDKNTPLHMAVSKLFKDPNIITRNNIIDQLIKRKGIDTNITNNEGKTPLELAQYNQFYESANRIQKMLIK